MFLIGTLGAFAAALFGRWLQFHPDKVMISGTFESPNTASAIFARKVIGLQGTFFVFFGVCAGISSLSFWSSSTLVQLLAFLIGAACGIYAAIYVRREVRDKAKIIPGPFGTWP